MCPLHRFYENPLYKNHKAQKTPKIKNFLRIMLKLVFSIYSFHIVTI